MSGVEQGAGVGVSCGLANATISVIVPTIGRPESLRRMLESLCLQTHGVTEVIIADGSSGSATSEVAVDRHWHDAGLMVRRIVVNPPNAVRQRVAAIERATSEYLLLLDDDVVLEPRCVESLLRTVLEDSSAVAAFADFNNQSWPMPTRAWRFYLRYALGMPDGSWQGRVVGPLLRFGYSPAPQGSASLDWLGTCNSLVRRSAYEESGGFSDFFLHRCTMNEDVDLGLKLARIGTILFSPSARMGHFHAPGGRVSPGAAAEDDLYNRYLVMCRTMGRSRSEALAQVLLFFVIETASNMLGAACRLRSGGVVDRTRGRLRALRRIVVVAADGGLTT